MNLVEFPDRLPQLQIGHECCPSFLRSFVSTWSPREREALRTLHVCTACELEIS